MNRKNTTFFNKTTPYLKTRVMNTHEKKTLVNFLKTLKAKLPRRVYHNILSYTLPSIPVSIPKPNNICFKCKGNGYYLTTMLDEDEDISICPICNYVNRNEFSDYSNISYACKNCRIIYSKCCLHNKNKSYNIYHAMIPTSYEIDGLVIEGMPLFESDEITFTILDFFPVKINYICSSNLTRLGKVPCSNAEYYKKSCREGTFRLISAKTWHVPDDDTTFLV